MASISHRYSIRWLPHQASEPTSTLVLTAESGYYIDIRLRNQSSGDVPSSLPVTSDPLLRPSTAGSEQTSLIHKTNPASSISKIFANVELDWAFAGQSVSSTDLPRTCTWHHWVDSSTKLLEDETISDSGTMYSRDDGMTLEKGAMVNPVTGIKTEYEEIWEDLPFTVPKALKCGHYVLTHDEETIEVLKKKSRGAVMQLGTWFQAIFRSDEADTAGKATTALTATRWAWDDAKAQWALLATYKVGDNEAPTPNDIESQLEKLHVGGVIHLVGQKWTCKELSRK